MCPAHIVFRRNTTDCSAIGERTTPFCRVCNENVNISTPGNVFNPRSDVCYSLKITLIVLWLQILFWFMVDCRRAIVSLLQSTQRFVTSAICVR